MRPVLARDRPAFFSFHVFTGIPQDASVVDFAEVEAMSAKLIDLWLDSRNPSASFGGNVERGRANHVKAKRACLLDAMFVIHEDNVLLCLHS